MHCIQNSCIGTPSPFNKPIEEINDIDFFSQQPEEIILTGRLQEKFIDK